MSATGRGRERNPRDFYRTPAWCVEELLHHEDLLVDVYDPACGDGAILEVLQGHGHDVHGLDIDAESAMHAAESLQSPIGVGDYLDPSRSPTLRCDVVMNPPYRNAAEFVRAALDKAGQREKVCALLRLGFLGSSRTRMDLVGPDSCLKSVYVLAKRPSFTGDSKTDASSYAWFVWQSGHKGPSTVSVTLTKTV
jgi:hypothetical protein